MEIADWNRLINVASDTFRILFYMLMVAWMSYAAIQYLGSINKGRWSIRTAHAAFRQNPLASIPVIMAVMFMVHAMERTWWNIGRYYTALGGPDLPGGPETHDGMIPYGSVLVTTGIGLCCLWMLRLLANGWRPILTAWPTWVAVVSAAVSVKFVVWASQVLY